MIKPVEYGRSINCKVVGNQYGKRNVIMDYIEWLSGLSDADRFELAKARYGNDES